MSAVNLSAHDVDFASLFDVVDSVEVVTTLRESLTACLTTACERDGIALSPEQIRRFAAECSRNAAQAVLGLGLK